MKMTKMLCGILFVLLLSVSGVSATSILDTGVHPQGCCANIDYSEATGGLVLAIPCVKAGDMYYAVELSFNGFSFDLLNYWQTDGDCASGSDGGVTPCVDCSCPDYASQHPSECGQTGALNFRITWGDTNDVDLHVVYYDAISGDNSEEIYFNESYGSITGGELDVDANAGCSNLTTSPVENIFYDTPPSGDYVMKICGWASCDSPSSSVNAQVLRDGNVIWQQTVEINNWENQCVEVHTYEVR